MAISCRSLKSQLQILFMAMSWSAGCALADQAVYRCGQEITNQPNDPSQCQKLLISSPTQIEGTRVQNGQLLKPAVAVSTPTVESSASPSSNTPDAHQRNAQARTILEDEWQKLSTRHAEMVRIFNAGQPALLVGESSHHPQYKSRAAEMQLQIERLVRDMQALKRELTRHAAKASSIQTQ